jgi:hypothetical protein
MKKNSFIELTLLATGFDRTRSVYQKDLVGRFLDWFDNHVKHPQQNS